MVLFGRNFSFGPARPIANPVPVANPVAGGFGLNNFPRPSPFPVSGMVTGLPSPSVGTVLPQTRNVPPQPLAAYPLATPTVGASFGSLQFAPTSLGGLTAHVSNAIGQRH